ncbi:hypothetical protein BJ508DRAFT_411179 [Ascobolus immersus RN42]|uniref:Uncharacterized protein n=1 Tax=Ascobolus immersus RN42 TaxID=1160509 RepID=A0A3N4IXU3_ASCIM|nr:hypothetical protein BJ508DRAFT_411179 [Ascobolus immersus RN42]
MDEVASPTSPVTPSALDALTWIQPVHPGPSSHSNQPPPPPVTTKKYHYDPCESWLEFYKREQPEFWTRKQFTLLEEHRNLILQCMIDEKWDMQAGLQATVEKFMEDVGHSPKPDADDTDSRRGWERMRASIVNRVKNNQASLASLGYVVKMDRKLGTLYDGDYDDSTRKRKRGRYSWKWTETDEEQRAWLRQTLHGLNYGTEDKWQGFLDIAVDVFGPGFTDFAIKHLNNRKIDNVSGSSTSSTRSNTERQTGDEQRMQVTEVESKYHNALRAIDRAERQAKDLDVRGRGTSITTPEPQTPGTCLPIASNSTTRSPIRVSTNPYVTPRNSPLPYVDRSSKRLSRTSSIDAATQTDNGESDKRKELVELIQTKPVYKLSYRATSQRNDPASLTLVTESIMQTCYFHELENANIHLWKEWNRMGLSIAGIGRGPLGHLVGNHIESGNGLEKTHKMEITEERVKLMRRMGQKYSQEADILTPIKFEDQEAIRVELP